MDSQVFEQLLFEDESATLDFKQGPYQYAGATDEVKSEILKDILGFANGWRRSEAYILIGVKEVRGGRSIVVGTEDHPQENDLQQFINSKTNRPIQFSYEVYPFEGQSIGIIRIELQPRPFYLLQNYGKLQKEKVYVRRGSSTDPTRPASLDEISQMGSATSAHSLEPKLSVEFARNDSDISLGRRTSLSAEWCDLPESKDIPLLEYRPSSGNSQYSFDVDKIKELLGDATLNKNYYRQLADYEFAHRLFRSIRIVISNTGPVAAMDVRVEMELRIGDGVGIYESTALPELPKRHQSRYDAVSMVARNIRPLAPSSPGDVGIVTNSERFKFVMQCGNIQPGRKIFSEAFLVGVRDSGTTLLPCKVFAENLRSPDVFSILIDAEITKTTLSVDDLTALADSM
ncbi:ATP-binding protein [Bremerella cremea]|uniref:AlbA family DNA-binding domain-containing protein n=1 Tax=Bremerella cremea TaxID=1031537 RepID=UPI0031EEC167